MFHLEFGFSTFSLKEEVYDCSILPLWLLHTDIVCRKLTDLDTEVGHLDQGDCHPTINVAARNQLGMLPFHREASVYAFNHSLCLHAEDTIH